MSNNEYFDSIEQLSIETEDEIQAKDSEKNAHLFSMYSDLGISSSDLDDFLSLADKLDNQQKQTKAEQAPNSDYEEIIDMFKGNNNLDLISGDLDKLSSLTQELERKSRSGIDDTFDQIDDRNSALKGIKENLASIERSVNGLEKKEPSTLEKLKTKADESGLTDIASGITEKTKAAFGKFSSRIKDTEIYETIREKGSSLAQKAKDSEVVGTIKEGASELSGEISSRVKNIDLKSCKQTSNHRIYYLIGKVSGYHYQSARFKNTNPSTYICKCLECGKEVSMLSNQVDNNLIIDPNYSLDRYEKARKIYFKYKLLNYSNDEIINEINHELIDAGPTLTL